MKLAFSLKKYYKIMKMESYKKYPMGHTYNEQYHFAFTKPLVVNLPIFLGSRRIRCFTVTIVPLSLDRSNKTSNY